MKRLILTLLLLLLSIVSGFYQERLKISVNYILEQSGRYPDFDSLKPDEKQKIIESNRADAPFDYYHNHETIRALYRFDTNGLAGLKWAVTAVFLIWFFILNFATLKTLGVQKNAIQSLPIIYCALVMLALIIYAGSKVGLNADHCYAVSRKIMGALQSVIPTFIVWPASKLWNSGKSI